jgi:DNA invertase Pin-like site-specific DNA recombinase
VSTHQQDLARQIKALKRVGRAVICADTASGKSMAGRPELTRTLDDLDSGDERAIAGATLVQRYVQILAGRQSARQGGGL